MAATVRYLTALPVFNEAAHLNDVLDQVVRHASDIVVIDDGSTDGTSEQLAKRTDVTVVTHAVNQGYGAALATAFQYALDHEYDVIVTIDCDGQHEPQRIGQLAAACKEADIVSGSRYFDTTLEAVRNAPADRRLINQTITQELNELLGLQLTDTFCGFKAYRVSALRKLHLTEPGYAMPLELWVQAARAGLRIVEVSVPLIYLDEERSFGGALDDADERLRYYRDVIRQAMLASCPSANSSQALDPKEVCAASEWPIGNCSLDPCSFSNSSSERDRC